MAWNGKILGAVIGSMFGWGGTIIGVIVGHLYDQGVLGSNNGSAFGFGGQAHLQADFFNCTFAIMGFIAKSDGRVSAKEIHLTQKIMQQLNLDADAKRRAIHEFSRGKQADFDYMAELNAFRRACWRRPRLLKAFLDVQLQIAYADGMSKEKHEALRCVFRSLGISDSGFRHFERQFTARSHYHQQGGGQSGFGPVSQKRKLADAYVILDVDEKAPDADVTKAYRRLMSKNHPDRLMAQGVPPEMIQLATQKTQEIKSAYDVIKEARGIS